MPTDNDTQHAQTQRRSTGASGPVINTLLDRAAIVSSFHDNKMDDDHQHRWRYADIYTAISPICKDFLTNIGITKTSAYSLCRRRHNHDLRHTFGSLAITRADIVEVQAWMGHADIQTTMRYVHHRDRGGEAKLRAEAFAVEPLPR